MAEDRIKDKKDMSEIAEVTQAVASRVSLKDSMIAGEVPRYSESRVYQKDKLSVIPFAVLLPSGGDLHLLESLRDSLEARHTKLQTANFETDRDAENRSREEAMLNQVLQWLNASEIE